MLSFIGFLELGARLTAVDMILIKPLLYYQGADIDVHRVADNAELLYELAPNSVLVDNRRKVTINSLGYRDSDRKKEKGKDVFRIICFGGSNTYGALVNDFETYPFYLEEFLNKRLKRKYEVWNAGVSAYVMSQHVEMAKRMVREYNPDLLLFQFASRGRRAFLSGTDYAHFFRINPSLYWENLRYIPAVNNRVGRWVFVHSYTYRTLVLLINHFKIVPAINPMFNSERLNEERLLQFYRETNPRIPVVAWEMWDTDNIFCCDESINAINVFNPAYYPPSKGKEYFESHPPKYVYKWYAGALFKELKRKSFI
jgi:hypothetical protein